MVIQRTLRTTVALASVALLALSRRGSGEAATGRLESTTFAAVGLDWRECLPSEDATAACGEPFPYAKSDPALPSAWLDWHARDLRLKTAGRDYRVIRWPAWTGCYSVVGMTERPSTLCGGDSKLRWTANVGIQSLHAGPAIVIRDGHLATVLWDGEDLRKTYGIDAAYEPAELGGLLVFIGRKANRYFVVFDGKRVGPDFEDMRLGTCCMEASYRPRASENGYRFNGSRQGREVQVVIRAASISAR